MSNFSRVLPKADFQFLDELGKEWAGDFRPGFPWIFGRSRPPGSPRSPGPAPHINFHEKSAPQTKSKAKWRRTKNPANDRGDWVPEGSLAGDFRPGFSGFLAGADPRDPPEIAGARTSSRTKKPAPQTNRMPRGGELKIPLDSLQEQLAVLGNLMFLF